jgi:hypothetical protein
MSGSKRNGAIEGNTGKFTDLTANTLTFLYGGVTPISLATYFKSDSAEYGVSVPLIKVTNGRFDFDPLGGKAELRAYGATTQFNIHNSTNSLPYVRMNSDQTIQFFNTVSVNGTALVLSTDSRLSDARVPTAHTQAWSTITETPNNLAGYNITDAVSATDNRLTAYKTVGTGVPASPANGDRCLEIVGNNTLSWYWDSTRSLWLSTEYVQISTPSASNMTGASDRGSQVPKVPNTSGFYVERIGINAWTSVAHSGTVFYTCTPGYWSRTNTTTSTNWTAFTTSTLAASQATFTDFGTNPNVAIPWSNTTNQIRWNFTSTGAPNMNYGAYANIRYYR